MGSCTSLIFLFLAISLGFANGGGVLIAQLYGARRTHELRRAASTLLITLVGLGTFLTVAGSAMGDKSYNLQCRFGTPFSYIVEQCGGFVVEPKKIVLGGPMMGLIATNLEAPNIKGTAGILFFTDKEDRSVENPTCIHCGKCLTVCPMKLEPLYMYKYYQKRDFENMQKYHILDCFECGSCSYNCPGRLPLTHTFKTAKLLFAARAAEEKARAEAAAKEAETK